MVALIEEKRIPKPNHSPLSNEARTRDVRDQDLVFVEGEFEKNEPSAQAVSKIMVVGDCDDQHSALAHLFVESGYQVIVVSNGLEALERAPEFLPDLIITEMVMDMLDGLVVCESLKQMEDFAEVPIIFLTSVDDERSVLRGLSAGACDYLIKPVNPREAFTRAQNHLMIRHLTLERNRANEVLNKTNEALRKANQEKNKLLGITTHDLKNPIASIRGIAGMFQNGDLGEVSECQSEAVQQILSAASGMMDLVEDLLSFSTLEEDQLELNKESHDVVSFVADITNVSVVNAVMKGIALRFDSEKVQATAQFDASQVRRVIQNFISNAIKFSEANTQVIVKLAKHEDCVEVMVDDQGPGIPENEQCKLFQEYGRTSVKPTGDEVSTGLGLSICRRLIEAHGGTIGMRNGTQGGSCFYFTLPLA